MLYLTTVSTPCGRTRNKNRASVLIINNIINYHNRPLIVLFIPTSSLNIIPQNSSFLSGSEGEIKSWVHTWKSLAANATYCKLSGNLNCKWNQQVKCAGGLLFREKKVRSAAGGRASVGRSPIKQSRKLPPELRNSKWYRALNNDDVPGVVIDVMTPFERSCVYIVSHSTAPRLWRIKDPWEVLTKITCQHYISRIILLDISTPNCINMSRDNDNNYSCTHQRNLM